MLTHAWRGRTAVLLRGQPLGQVVVYTKHPRFTLMQIQLQALQIPAVIPHFIDLVRITGRRKPDGVPAGIGGMQRNKARPGIQAVIVRVIEMAARIQRQRGQQFAAQDVGGAVDAGPALAMKEQPPAGGCSFIASAGRPLMQYRPSTSASGSSMQNQGLACGAISSPGPGHTLLCTSRSIYPYSRSRSPSRRAGCGSAISLNRGDMV